MDDIYDPQFVKGVFDRCSDRYITFSLIFSFGFTERWRQQCVAAMPAFGAGGARGYDLMAGTGEVWPHLLKRFDDIGAITAVDISSGMHRRAMERLHAHRAHRVEFIEDDVLASDLPSESADFVISTFGLKTFNPEQHARLAALIARVLKPGGVFSMIEASDPKGWWLRPLYLFHLKLVLPLVERFFLRGAQDFSMIGTYSTNFGSAAEVANILRDNGLEVEFSKYFFGCATGVAGRKASFAPKGMLMAPVKINPDNIRAFKDAESFYKWLGKHHDKDAEIWIKIHKVDSGLKSITPKEAIDVVLCLGWIDGLRKGFDDKSFLQRYTRRTGKSIWSQINVDNVARLIKDGRMTEHGLREVDAAKADGRWARAYNSKDMKIPDDLQAAIDAEPKAKAMLAKLSAQNRFALAFRTHNMKTEAGRTKKIAALVAMLKRGETIYPQGKK